MSELQNTPEESLDYRPVSDNVDVSDVRGVDVGAKVSNILRNIVNTSWQERLRSLLYAP